MGIKNYQKEYLIDIVFGRAKKDKYDEIHISLYDDEFKYIKDLIKKDRGER